MENILLAFIWDTLPGTVITDLFIDFQAMCYFLFIIYSIQNSKLETK